MIQKLNLFKRVPSDIERSWRIPKGFLWYISDIPVLFIYLFILLPVQKVFKRDPLVTEALLVLEAPQGPGWPQEQAGSSPVQSLSVNALYPTQSLGTKLV